MGNELNKKNTMSQSINLEKAKKILFYVIGFLSFSLFTYLPSLLSMKLFDFGIIFEGISLLFAFITIYYINKKKPNITRNYLVISIFSLCWLIVYDLIDFICHLEELITSSYFFFCFLDVLMIVIVILQIKAYNALCKSAGDSKYKENTDWFYEE